MEAINCKDMGDAVKKMFKALCKFINKRDFRNCDSKNHGTWGSIVLKIWWSL